MKNTLVYTLTLLLICACQPNQKPNTTAAGMTGTNEQLKPDPKRFQAEIDSFVAWDQIHPPVAGQIIFVGSSSIRLWDSLATDMAPLTAVNRGFGGATIPELIRYAEQVVFPHSPSTIVFYCGENDISEGASSLKAFRSFKSFVQLVIKRLPDTKIYYLPMKPSIARWNLWPDFQKANRLIAQFIEAQDQLEYLDITSSMLTESSQIDSTIFIEDGLHMNRKGYERWKAIVRAALLSEQIQ